LLQPQFELQPQPPHWHEVVHVCVSPEPPHERVSPAAQAPSPTQLVPCQAPLASHVCGLTPQLPQATYRVWSGEHTPVHTPATQVCPVHATGVPHVPDAVHVCTPLPEHWTAPAVQLPEHDVPEHALLSQVTGELQWCDGSQVSTELPEHVVVPGVLHQLEQSLEPTRPPQAAHEWAQSSAP
jgi:hypothetical protein